MRTTILKLEIVLSACMIDITLHLSHFKHWLVAHCRQKYEFVELLNDFGKTHWNDIGVNDNLKIGLFVIPPQRKILLVTNLEFLHSNVLDFNPWDFSTWQLRPVQICPHAYHSILNFSTLKIFPRQRCLHVREHNEVWLTLHFLVYRPFQRHTALDSKDQKILSVMHFK